MVLAGAAGTGWALGLFEGGESSVGQDGSDQMLAEPATGADTSIEPGVSTISTAASTTTTIAASTAATTTPRASYDNSTFEVLLTDESVVTADGELRLDDPMSHVWDVVTGLTGTPPQPHPSASELCGSTLYFAGNGSVGFLIWMSPRDTLEVLIPGGEPLASAPTVGTDRGLRIGASTESMFQLYPDAEYLRDVEGQQTYRLEPGTNLLADVGDGKVHQIKLGYDLC